PVRRFPVRDEPGRSARAGGEPARERWLPRRVGAGGDRRRRKPAMKLTCYALRPDPPTLPPPPPPRARMGPSPANHAYRCLPLNIANSHGWEILSPCAFELTWSGGTPARALTARALDGYPGIAQFIMSHFSYGIVTFLLGYLFRTEPGWDLFATGSLNNPKDGIAPLTGVIETDWLPYPFTMNWQMTRPGT